MVRGLPRSFSAFDGNQHRELGVRQRDGMDREPVLALTTNASYFSTPHRAGANYYIQRTGLTMTMNSRWRMTVDVVWNYR